MFQARVGVLAAACMVTALGWPGPADGQTSADAMDAQPSTSAEPLPRLNAEQLATLVGPVALYPDPLIAQILPASTYPIDIVRAARLVRSGATQAQVDEQDWDASIKALTHYPSVLEWMDASIEWTQQLGQAFVAQPEEVMQAVQNLRLRAADLGNLATTAQQEVLVDDQAVRIVPTNPEIVYVPVYQPTVVYTERPPWTGGFISFGSGYACGTWLDLDCDWGRRWCYRPGWTWNRWRDNIIVGDHRRVLEFRRGFEWRPDRRPPTSWRRIPGRPLTFAGRRLEHPWPYDEFRGREHRPDDRPQRWDRDDGSQPETGDRGRVSRWNTPAPPPAIRAVAPTSLPTPHTPPPNHAITRTPDAGATPPARSPARITPPAVHIAPPAAPSPAMRPQTPAYMQSPPSQRAPASRPPTSSSPRPAPAAPPPAAPAAQPAPTAQPAAPGRGHK